MSHRSSVALASAPLVALAAASLADAASEAAVRNGQKLESTSGQAGGR